MIPEVKAGQAYWHAKTGRLYVVKKVSIDVETYEYYVDYVRLGREKDPNADVWTRSYARFIDGRFVFYLDLAALDKIANIIAKPRVMWPPLDWRG